MYSLSGLVAKIRKGRLLDGLQSERVGMIYILRELKSLNNTDGRGGVIVKYNG